MKTLDERLKFELNALGMGYTRGYRNMSNATKCDLIRKMKGRRLASEEHAFRQRSKDTSENDIYVGAEARSVFEYTAGGGRRVIRGTRSLGG